MKETWFYYDYLKRCRLLLLLGAVLGAFLGFVFYYHHHDPKPYLATAKVSFGDKTVYFEDRLVLHLPTEPALEATFTSGNQPSERAAVASVRSAVTRAENITNGVIKIKDFSVERPAEGVWWKPSILGSILGILLVIGGTYIWEAAQAYHRRHSQAGAKHA